MVDALREVRRVLKPRGVLVNLQPVNTPMAVEVVGATRTIWDKRVASYGTPEDIAAAEGAVQKALSDEWFLFEKSFPYDFEIYCDTVEDLADYVRARKLPEADIPYKEMEDLRREPGTDGQTSRLRCRRPWLMSIYRKK